jgi:hypothetical protein
MLKTPIAQGTSTAVWVAAIAETLKSRDVNSSKKSNNRQQHKRQVEHQGTLKPVETPLARGTSTSVMEASNSREVRNSRDQSNSLDSRNAIGSNNIDNCKFNSSNQGNKNINEKLVAKYEYARR